MIPSPSRYRLDAPCSTMPSRSSAARILDTVLLWRPTSGAISVTPSSWRSGEKHRRIATVCSITEAPRRDWSDGGEAMRWLYDVVLRPGGELRDVLGPVLADDDDVLFAIAAGTRFAVENRDHRLHRDDHARFDDGVDVLTQLEPGLAAVVVAEHSEGVSVAEGAVGEESVFEVDLVEFGRDVLAHRSRLDEFDSALVHLDVDV